tara:strand:+ start:3580 stop:4329 length:750 start_codon:yes stop_codon:yes gene_type:complete
MIKRLKNKIKRLIDLRVNLIKDQQRLNEQTTFCYSQISQLFKEDSFIPFSAWAISPCTILHILNDISINKRRNIIEFGSGASTFFIAKLLKVMEINATFFSVESDKKWAYEMERQLKIYKLEDYVKIIYAPLKEVQDDILFRDQKTWYDSKVLERELLKIKKIDLVLVDGPFGGSTPYARYSAIPFLELKLASNYSIYLDDINRIHENVIIQEWKNKLNCEVKYIDRYAKISNSQDFDVTPFQLQNFPL